MREIVAAEKEEAAPSQKSRETTRPEPERDKLKR
jgi:hypothetical protein